MKIELINLQLVKADGVIYGNFSEACSRLPDSLTDLQSALEDFVRSGEDAKTLAAAQSDAITAFKTAFLNQDAKTIAAMIAEDAKNEKEKAIEAAQAEVEAAQARLEELSK